MFGFWKGKIVEGIKINFIVCLDEAIQQENSFFQGI